MKLARGILIVVEGIDGSGKSTLAQNIAAALNKQNLPVILTKEPGGTPAGIQLRSILQNQPHPLCPKAEFLLFAADRAQHFHELVLPQLQQKKIIISDRMADSSLVYQGYGRGLDKETLSSISAWAMGDVKPDITIYIHVPYEVARARIHHRNELTVFEKEHAQFTQKLIQGFKDLAEKNKNGISIDGTQDEQEITQHAVEKIKNFMQNNNWYVST